MPLPPKCVDLIMQAVTLQFLKSNRLTWSYHLR